MLQIKKFTFNPFAENTYVVSAPNQECIIIDPGMINHDENQQLEEYIQTQSLTPIQLWNTHCHIDHVLGNQFVSKKYGLQLQAHQSRSEEHTSELQSRENLVCRLLLEKKN